MTIFWQAVLSGLALGGIYGLVALGFNITYNTTKTLNFGQGEFLSLGALVGASVLALLSAKGLTGVPDPADVTLTRYLIALGISVSILAGLGVLLYFIAISPFAGKPGLSWVMSTIGFGILIQNGAIAIWGLAPLAMPSPLGDDIIRVFGAGVRPQEIMVLVVMITIMVGLDLIMRRTKLGKALLAVAHNRQAASLMGINVTAMMVVAYVIGSSLAAVAGVLVAPIATASAFVGLTIALKAFAAAIVGGLSNPRGCILGGFLLGLLEALVGLWHAELREISAFVLIIVALTFWPQGLLGRRLMEKV